MADFGIQVFDPATGALMLNFNESTMKDYGYVDISTNGNTPVAVINANTTLQVEDNVTPTVTPTVVLDTANSRIVTSGGVGFNVRARLVDYQ